MRRTGKMVHRGSAGVRYRLVGTPKGYIETGPSIVDPVVVGDRVHIIDVGDNEARIESVMGAAVVLTRPQRGSTTSDQILWQISTRRCSCSLSVIPIPTGACSTGFSSWRRTGDSALIGVNKIDLDETLPDGTKLSGRSLVLRGDLPVLYFSTKNGEGIPELREALTGKTTVLTGPSGVGKSSILNELGAERFRDVGAISASTGKGRHTTTSAELIRLDDETFVADTPGIRSLAMHGVASDVLDQRFREFRPWLGQCFYPDCKHLTEPGCAVLEAVAEGKIGRERYESYAALRRGDRE